MSLDEIIDRERKRAFGFTDDRRCLLTYGDFRRLLMEIEAAAKRKECELLAQIAELRQKIDDGKFFTPKAARDAIAGERPLDEMLKAPLPTGNAAAMRAALLNCARYIQCLLGVGMAGEVTINDNIKLSADNLVKAALAALSAPPRNCNRHTGWLTAIKEFNDTEGRRKPWGDDVYDTRFLDWLFAPAAERKGDGDGE